MDPLLIGGDGNQGQLILKSLSKCLLKFSNKDTRKKICRSSSFNGFVFGFDLVIWHLGGGDRFSKLY